MSRKQKSIRPPRARLIGPPRRYISNRETVVMPVQTGVLKILKPVYER